MQSRWKSPVLWAATIANIATVIGLFWPTLNIDPFIKAAGIVVVILTEFGILNNPTNPKGL